MKIISGLLVLISLHCTAQNADIVHLKDLQAVIQKNDQRILVLNFWATWCGPCVKEMPMFENLNEEAGDRVEVVLVSMDLDLDPNPEKVYKFIDRKKIRSTVVILDEPDPNAWINEIDESWSGALPATMVLNRKTGQRKFVGKALGEGELEKLIAAVQ